MIAICVCDSDECEVCEDIISSGDREMPFEFDDRGCGMAVGRVVAAGSRATRRYRPSKSVEDSAKS
jgi:hypothetical protein